MNTPTFRTVKTVEVARGEEIEKKERVFVEKRYKK